MKNLNQILIIDDDPITNYLNKRLIERTGLCKEILVAVNGVEALKLLSAKSQELCQCPELIFLDINMPIMSGLEFLEAYQSLNFENKPEVILYLLTTSTNRYDLEKLNKYKIAGILNKPLTKETINDIVLVNYKSA